MEQLILTAIRKIILKPELVIVMHIPTILAYWPAKVPKTILTAFRSSTTLPAREAMIHTARSKGKLKGKRLVRRRPFWRLSGLRS